jgi:hypothetical protein
MADKEREFTPQNPPQTERRPADDQRRGRGDQDSRDDRPSLASRVNSRASPVRVSRARASLASPVSRLHSGRLPSQRPGGSSARAPLSSLGDGSMLRA